jgi:hypothetical protein
MPNFEVKVRETAYSSTDAVWNLEALINQLYGNPSEYSEAELRSEQKTIDIPKVNGEINDAALLAAYTTMWANQRNFYNSVSDVNKHITAVDVELIEDTQTNLQLSVTTYIGLESNENINLTPTYDWRYGKNLGTCDNTIKKGDAAQELNKSVNGKLINPFSTYSFTYSNISKVNLRPPSFIYNSAGFSLSKNFKLNNPNDVSLQDNKRDYLLFHSGSSLPNHTDCVPNTDIPWYANNIVNSIIPRIINFNGAIPSGNSIFKINCVGDILLSSNSTVYLHSVDIFNGKISPKTVATGNPNIILLGG